MPSSKPCGNPTACPPRSLLPVGTLAPNTSNQCRAIRQAQLSRGNTVVTGGTRLLSGTFVVPSDVAYVAPTVLATIHFCPPFNLIPVVNLTVDDQGNVPAWHLHVRNVTPASFDVVLVNANKGLGVSFAITWNAFGVANGSLAENPFATTTSAALDLTNSAIINCPSVDAIGTLTLGGSSSTASTVVGRTGASTDIRGNVQINGDGGANGEVLTSNGTTASWEALPEPTFVNTATSPGLDMATFGITNCASVDNAGGELTIGANATGVIIGQTGTVTIGDPLNNGTITIRKPLTLSYTVQPTSMQLGYTYIHTITASTLLTNTNEAYTAALTVNTTGVWSVHGTIGLNCTGNGTLTSFKLSIVAGGTTYAVQQIINTSMITSSPPLVNNVSAIVYSASNAISLNVLAVFTTGQFSVGTTDANFRLTRLA